LFFGKRVPELRFARIDRVGEQRRKGAVEWGGGDLKSMPPAELWIGGGLQTQE
jgi:hypothetical protein